MLLFSDPRQSDPALNTEEPLQTSNKKIKKTCGSIQKLPFLKEYKRKIKLISNFKSIKPNLFTFHANQQSIAQFKPNYVQFLGNFITRGSTQHLAIFSPPNNNITNAKQICHHTFPLPRKLFKKSINFNQLKFATIWHKHIHNDTLFKKATHTLNIC